MKLVEGLKHNGGPVVGLDDALEVIEDLARQGCYSNKVDRDYNGQVAGTVVTYSGSISTYADALRLLEAHQRFRVVAEYGRSVAGYWPENDPEKGT